MRPTRARIRWGTAWAVAALGLVVLAALAARRVPALAPRPPVVDLGPTTLAVLDTVALAERTITAQIDGVVERLDGAQTVWLEARGREMAVDLGPGADTSGVQPERRLLVVGRLRGADGRRWLDASAWTLVETAAVPPRPDSVRFGPAVDRSAAAGDRSGVTP